jgi:hypothetical protein
MKKNEDFESYFVSGKQIQPESVQRGPQRRLNSKNSLRSSNQSSNFHTLKNSARDSSGDNVQREVQRKDAGGSPMPRNGLPTLGTISSNASNAINV